jgi:hypothetical protein
MRRIDRKIRQERREPERRVVLRVDAGAAAWLAAARAREREAPPALRGLLRGRSRVELSQAEADAAIRWALAGGWDDEARPPLFIYDGADAVARS